MKTGILVNIVGIETISGRNDTQKLNGTQNLDAQEVQKISMIYY